MKVMSKMGISTAQSYCGAQIFEAIGLNQEVIDKYFTWTASRIGGIGLDVIAEEAKARHDHAFPERPLNGHTLDAGGQYQYRKDGEYHLFNPETVHKLQYACRTGNYKVFKEYSELVNNQAKRLCTLRGLFDFKFAEKPIPHRGSRAGRGDHEAVQVGRHVLRLDQQGGPRDAGHRHEPHRRQEQHRRGRRRPGPLHSGAERRLQEQRHQAGGLGPLRRDQRIPGQRQGTADQDGPGRQAGRGRPAARQQGLSVDRQGALLDAGRRPDLAAAAPRHLLHRGPGGADSRPEERQPPRPHQRQAGGRGRRRHHRGRRRQGPCRRGADQRPRRRHRRLAADQHQARRRPVGTGPGRDAADAGAQRPAQPDRRRGGRPAEDRPRRGRSAPCSAPRSSASPRRRWWRWAAS